MVVTIVVVLPAGHTDVPVAVKDWNNHKVGWADPYWNGADAVYTFYLSEEKGAVTLGKRHNAHAFTHEDADILIPLDPAFNLITRNQCAFYYNNGWFISNNGGQISVRQARTRETKYLNRGGSAQLFQGDMIFFPGNVYLRVDSGDSLEQRREPSPVRNNQPTQGGSQPTQAWVMTEAQEALLETGIPGHFEAIDMYVKAILEAQQPKKKRWRLFGKKKETGLPRSRLITALRREAKSLQTSLQRLFPGISFKDAHAVPFSQILTANGTLDQIKQTWRSIQAQSLGGNKQVMESLAAKLIPLVMALETFTDDLQATEAAA